MQFYQDFFDGKPIEGVAFIHNQAVRVVVGPHAGQTGSLISLEAIEPVPIFLMELESGVDVLVKQTQIERIG